MLKYLKGARILVDCETGELHMDLGNGQSKPIGGGGDVIIIHDTINDTVTASAGAYELLYGKFGTHPVPVQVYEITNVNNMDQYTAKVVTEITDLCGQWDKGNFVGILTDDHRYYSICEDGRVIADWAE